ncbi:glycoside hydrolase family 18 protein [Photobacterium angustum]|uniref:chitinase n=2 Tax=Photobacterium angustum TaxID=661 RepID=A0ABX5H8B4_PHOAN|nr:glycoside hydrolase family 18 protein [Photobacterium angustum]PSX12338.1 chitinase [Photobacterium angustum]
MRYFSRNYYLSVIMATLVSCFFSNQASANAIKHSSPVIAAYYPDWKVYTPKTPYSANMLPVNDLTHVIYAFLAVCGPVDASPDNIKKIMRTQCKNKPIGTAIILDDYAALQIKLKGKTSSKVGYHGNFGQLKLLSDENPNLSILPSFGGWTLSEPFHTVALNDKYRKTFVDSAIKLIQKYDFFDGIQIDWEYPGGHGLSGLGIDNVDNERLAYTKLIHELRTQLNTLGIKNKRTYQLSAAVNGAPKTLPGIDWKKVSKDLDQIFLMSFDFLGSWGPTVGHHSNLYSTPLTPDDMSVDSQVNSLLKQGVDRKKIIIGSPFYGRGWKGVDNASADKLEGLSSKGTMDKGSDIADPGYFNYSDIVKYLIKNKKMGYQYYYDEKAEAAVLFSQKKNEYISFEDKRSLQAKVDYVKKHQLGGVFGWEATSDHNHELIKLLSKSFKQ